MRASVKPVVMDTPEADPFDLLSQRLGALPVVAHFLDRAGLPAVLDKQLPAADARVRLAPATAVRLVVTNLLIGRQPLYALGEWAAPFAPHLLGLAPGQVEAVNDDRVGRALEALFDADRASLLTELVLGVVREFGVDTTELHNDSTSINVSGVYRDATGAERGGKATPVITWGHSKDHRPDLLTELPEETSQVRGQVLDFVAMVRAREHRGRRPEGSRFVDGAVGRVGNGDGRPVGAVPAA